MRFIIIRKADASTESGLPSSAEFFDAMGAYMTAMGEAGVLRGGDGVMPSSKGARVSFHASKPTVTDGPFTETKELIAGFNIIEVASLVEAIDWARRWPPSDNGGEVEIEIRQLYDADDFGENYSDEHRARREAFLAEQRDKAPAPSIPGATRG